jgi:phage shock protein A
MAKIKDTLENQDRNEQLDFKFREYERQIVKVRNGLSSGMTDGKVAERIINNIIWGDSHFNPNR